MITIRDTIAQRLYISQLSEGLPLRPPTPAELAHDVAYDAFDRTDIARARAARRLPQTAIDAIASQEWLRMRRAWAVDHQLTPII